MSNEKQIKGYLLSIQKKCSLLKPLINGCTYTIATEIEVRENIEKIQDDGGVVIEYKAWQTGKAIIQNEQGEKMPAKEQKKYSQKLYARIVLDESRTDDWTDREYYDHIMPKLLHYYSMILKQIAEWDKAGL